MRGEAEDGRSAARRPRGLGQAQVGWPPALRKLKDLLHEAHLAAGTPTLDAITTAIDKDDGLPGAPSRDTVHRIITKPTLPPGLADTESVAKVLARMASWNEQDLVGQVREQWIQARRAEGVGRPIGEFTGNDELVLADLEVQPVFDDGGTGGFGLLPAYAPRAHDEQLTKTVTAAQAGTSGIAVLVGGSSTGKTRALWESVRKLPKGWRLWRPLGPAEAVAELPDVAPHTVIWLNEAQSYLRPAPFGEQLAAGLSSLLHDPSRGPVLLLATLWPGDWNTLITRPGSEDPHSRARALLQSHKIKVPEAFTSADLARLDGADPRLRQAAERAPDGQVAQYLAGVPVLLDRFEDALPPARALIEAAMDARRLGAGPRLPRAWLAEAVPGYLTDTEWDAAGDDWLDHALDYVTKPCKGIPGILRTTKSTAPRNQRGRRTPAAPAGDGSIGQGPLYVLADYLDQYGRHHMAETIPPVDFWTAAARHAHPDDLNALGDAAWDRGLYRDAAQLHRNATLHQARDAPATLVRHFQHLHPTDPRPARWVAAHAALSTPSAVVSMLEELRQADAWEQVTVLLARNPAAHVSLDDAAAVGLLLDAFWQADAWEQITALLARDPAAHVSLDDPAGVALLLDQLWQREADEQATALAERAVSHVSLRDPGAVGILLDILQAAGFQEHFTALAERAVVQVSLDNLTVVSWLMDALREAGADEQVTALLARNPGAHAPLDCPPCTVYLLDALRQAGAHEQATVLAERAAAHTPIDDADWLLDGLRQGGADEQVAVLLARDPAAHVPLDDRYAVATMLKGLHEVGADEQATVLAERAAAHTSFNDPETVVNLLDALREVGAAEQITILLARNPGAHLPLDDAAGVARMLDGLRQVGADEQVTALLARDPAAHAALNARHAVARMLEALRTVAAHDQVAILTTRLPAAGLFDLFIETYDDGERFRFGREPDGSAAPPWTWNDLDGSEEPDGRKAPPPPAPAQAQQPDTQPYGEGWWSALRERDLSTPIRPPFEP